MAYDNNLCNHCVRDKTDCPRMLFGTTYCTDYKPHCQAVQHNDLKRCVRCDLTWDMNDPDRPVCLSIKELGQAVIAEINLKFNDVNCELCGTWERNLIDGACKECRVKHYKNTHKACVGPFLDHLKRLLPVEGDRDILLAYMAACIQYKGVKFQWAPLIQGTEGNGKTLFTRCVVAAIGSDDACISPISEIAEHSDKMFVGVDNIYFSANEKDFLKMMIGSNKLCTSQSGTVGDNFMNFILSSGHKDVIPMVHNDRRFRVFSTAQQSDADIKCDGMGGDYFQNLYSWLGSGGYRHVANYLATYAIPDALNPAGACHQAPTTCGDEIAYKNTHGTCECGGALLRGCGFCEKGYGAYKVCVECLKVTEFEQWDVD